MGCTQSSPRSSSPPPNALAPGTPTTRHRQRNSRRRQGSSTSSLAAQHIPTSRRPANAPLAHPLAWRSTSRTWTPALLARERAAFFDTRVTGSPEAWGAVQLATSMVRGDSAAARDEEGGDDAEDGLRAAKAVLDAAGLVVPTGFLADGVWDERGVLYKLPRWVVSDPLNIESDEPGSHADAADDKDGRLAGPVPDRAASETEMVSAKGKAATVANDGDGGAEGALTPVKLRLSDRGTDVVLSVSPDATKVRDIVDSVRKEAGVARETRVTLAYMGKMLKDGEALAPQDWRVGDVINCLVFR